MQGGRPASLLSVAALAVAVLAAVAALGLVGLRGWSAWSVGHLLTLTGGEGPGVEGVWRVCAGRSLYPPLASQPTVQFYNAGFYGLYGGAAALLTDCGEGLIRLSRLLSFGWVLLALLLLAWPLRRRPLACLLAATLPLAAFYGWWHWAVRPDLAAMTLQLAAALAGVAALGAPEQRRALVLAAGAGLLLALAWLCKQNAVEVAAGLSLLALLHRRHRLLPCVLLPPAVAVGLALLLGGAGYREHLLAATGPGYGLEPLVALANLRGALAKGGFLLLPALAVALLRLRRDRRDPQAVLFLVALAVAAVFAARPGASTNYYFVAALLGTWLLAGEVARLPARPAAWLGGLVAAGLFASQLAVLGGLQGVRAYGRAEVASGIEAQRMTLGRETLLLDSWFALSSLGGDYRRLLIDPNTLLIEAVVLQARARLARDRPERLWVDGVLTPLVPPGYDFVGPLPDGYLEYRRTTP